MTPRPEATSTATTLGPDDVRTVGTPVDGHVPDVAPDLAWDDRRLHYDLVAPANRRRFTVIVVGTGLAGAGAAAALGELGYQVECFTLHDAPRRAHSVAAQGGINAARARKVDNDSLHRFVKDTVKGGDFRGREADAFRLAQESVRVIDHMNAIGAPFAREYGGRLATRSFGGVQVSRTYYTRGQTGQQLQVAGADALLRQVARGTVTLHTRQEMLDLVVADGRAQGVVVRDLVTGKVRAVTAHAVILATGGYGNIYDKSTLARNSNATAAWRAHRRGAYFANPAFVQFHPTALPLMSQWQSKTILMSESLRNDGRIWVPLRADDDRAPQDVPEDERDYYLERRYPTFGNLTPRDVASRAARERIDAGYGVGPLKNAVYLDFADAIARLGKDAVVARYSNLFHMYQQATGDDPLSTPMRIAPGAHFAMGGLWSDYDLMTSVPGLFVGGEVGWGYHGANRLGANSLLSACVDGWFTLPYAVPSYLAPLLGTPALAPDHDAVAESLDAVRSRTGRLLSTGGTQGPARFHRRLGEILYRSAGVTRTPEGLAEGIADVRALREEFWQDVRVTGEGDVLNQELERAGRVADYLEMAELLCVDALDRDESCGAHFRADHQTPGGEAQRDDAAWCRVSAWESPAPGATDARFVRHDEPLTFQAVPLQTRNYA
ncbi:succinate dehydrogenase or fumarate reductase, flavoprotein subunit [Cellulomonas flavigena DSM 20109]|uniref:succinate dehydrogenase n=1 Tax=Cellulomonas flavigena (strain ATCC 482 / DSM 20109 / BCRC 11376 / JCM 18109 / NBRC 3775 / NCIMB 8073 / NRS 134) TaxID=446466 RepID=D5UF03_CELFN|nr:fumarate reductase/succinate dehydrogenase flavoprotein subunit [Cellulomonas flavigena]ADG74813.1 succinate dehydrogenase or fumarate reductase, flavoprotein subunit [Cellulomonas flavigena DSM 20109]